MPLARSVLLAPNFTAGELGADDPTADARIIDNLVATAEWLQVARAEVGAPLRVTSGYRSPARNAAVGGSETSDHPNGLAGDFVPVGVSQFEAYRRLRGAHLAGRLPPFDQLIFYPVEGHIHVGLGPRLRRQTLIKLAEGSFANLAGGLVERLRGFV